MQYISPDPKVAIANFLKEFLPDIKSGEIKIASRHIDEIVPTMSENKEEQFKLAIELYAELIEQYRDDSQELMAVMVIDMDYEDSIRPHKLTDLVNGDLGIYTPPELYLIPRADSKSEPHILEEYKLPLKQDFIKPHQGIVYAYYRTYREDLQDVFLPGFYFEHYPAN